MQPGTSSAGQRRVLFVDDEPRVLDALRRVVRGRLQGWEPSFVEGGAEALRVLAATRFDAVVTDLRMPFVDGRQVLEAARRHCPTALRIALTGHTEMAVAIETLTTAHQLLAKPCTFETLSLALCRPFDAEREVRDQRVRAVLGRSDVIPQLPAVCRDLNAMLLADRVDMAAIAAVLEQDVALSARVLRLATSPYFGLAGRISTLRQAIMILGLETIRALVTCSAALGSMTPKAVPGLDLAGLQARGLRVARVARAIAQHDPRLGDGICIAALTHDIGLLILATHLPEDVGRVVARARVEGISFADAERAEHCVGHAELGACLLARWGMPTPVVEAVAYHHGPPPIEHRSPAPMDALFLAARIIECAPDRPLALPDGYLGALGLETHMPSLLALANETQEVVGG